MVEVGWKDLETWAGSFPTRDAQGDLPLLLRLLVHDSVPDAEFIDFPYRDDIGQKGFDGITRTSEATQYVPKGLTVWEMGVGLDYKDKVKKDYKKRTDAGVGPDNEPLSNCTFIFVTPRKWIRIFGIPADQVPKRTWQRDRTAEKKWRAVRIYDAQDLQNWLGIAPAVSHWFLGQCGKPRSVFSIDKWFFDRWCHAQYPQMTQQEVLSELGQAAAQHLTDLIKNWLTPTPAAPAAVTATLQVGLPAQLTRITDPRLLSLRMPDPEHPPGPSDQKQRSRLLAYFAAVLLDEQRFSKSERLKWLSRLVVVETLEEWRKLMLIRKPLILISIFGSTGEVHQTHREKGHQVLLPLSHADYQDWPNPAAHCVIAQPAAPQIGAPTI